MKCKRNIFITYTVHQNGGGMSQRRSRHRSTDGCKTFSETKKSAAVSRRLSSRTSEKRPAVHAEPSLCKRDGRQTARANIVFGLKTVAQYWKNRGRTSGHDGAEGPHCRRANARTPGLFFPLVNVIDHRCGIPLLLSFAIL